MDDEDRIRLTFPASPSFTRIGRVAAVGLALRLGFEVGMVEQLRKAVDKSVTALQGEGRIAVEAVWETGDLIITLSNDDAALKAHELPKLVERLSKLVHEVSVEGSSIELKIPNQR